MFAKTSLVVLAGPALLASAFPEIARMVAERNIKERQLETPQLAEFPEFPGTPNHALFNQFDAAQQLVSTSGDHEFREPGEGDIRGPCAGLNAAANHGYIQRDGVVDAASINTGLWEAFGLDKTATIFLETATSFFNGDPISGRWSIGPHSDKTSSLPPLIGNALGNETGICAYGHLRSEGDASITRGDWLAPTMNSNCASYPTFMEELFDLANKRTGGNITPRVLAEHSSNRKAYSVANNPYYFSPAYAGVAFTFGAHMFAYHLLANHSAEEPRGFLTQDVFMDFFSYKRVNGQLQYKYGYERIPDNWYKRHPLDPWTLSDIAISTAQQCASYPKNCQVGGNTGTVNSFSGVDAGDITGGLINSFTDLSDPAKAGCFIAQSVQADTPSFLSKLLGNGPALQAALAAVDERLGPAVAPLKNIAGGCQGVPAGKSMFDYGINFPGANQPSEGDRPAQ